MILRICIKSFSTSSTSVFTGETYILRTVSDKKKLFRISHQQYNGTKSETWHAKSVLGMNFTSEQSPNLTER